MTTLEQAALRLDGRFACGEVVRLGRERAIAVAPALFAGLDPPLLSRDEVLDALRAGHVPLADLRLYLNRVSLDLAALRAVEDGRIRPAVLDQLIAQGVTVVIDRAHKAFPAIAALAGHLARRLGHRIVGSAVLSFTGRSGIAPHFDEDDLLVVQVEGDKEWAMLGAPVGPRPVDTAPLGDQPVRRIVLGPGDAMFVPAGQRHRCSSSAAHSLHLGFLVCGANTVAPGAVGATATIAAAESAA